MYKIMRSSGKPAWMSGPGLGGRGLYERQSCPAPQSRLTKSSTSHPPQTALASLTTPETAPCRRVTDWEEGQSFATSTVVKYTRSSKHFVGIL